VTQNEKESSANAIRNAEYKRTVAATKAKRVGQNATENAESTRRQSEAAIGVADGRTDVARRRCSSAVDCASTASCTQAMLVAPLVELQDFRCQHAGRPWLNRIVGKGPVPEVQIVNVTGLQSCAVSAPLMPARLPTHPDAGKTCGAHRLTASPSSAVLRMLREPAGQMLLPPRRRYLICRERTGRFRAENSNASKP
jgi:hypothetical protein